MPYLIQSKAQYFYTAIRNKVFSDNNIGVTVFIPYIRYPKTTITTDSWDTNTHLPQHIYTAYTQEVLFTVNCYRTAQKLRKKYLTYWKIIRIYFSIFEFYMWITLQFKGKMRVLARQKCSANKNRYHSLLFSKDWASCSPLRGFLCLTQCGKSVLIVCETNCLRNSSIPGLDHYRQALMIICSLCLRRTGSSRTLSRISILSEFVSLCGSFSLLIHWTSHWR